MSIAWPPRNWNRVQPSMCRASSPHRLQKGVVHHPVGYLISSSAETPGPISARGSTEASTSSNGLTVSTEIPYTPASSYMFPSSRIRGPARRRDRRKRARPPPPPPTRPLLRPLTHLLPHRQPQPRTISTIRRLHLPPLHREQPQRHERLGIQHPSD